MNSFLLAAMIGLSQQACAQQTSEQWWPWPAAAKEAEAQKVPDLKLDGTSVTVSGLSAGAFMATQLHVAYSATIKGSGAVAGGPWNCAEGSVWQANGTCMNDPSRIDTAELVNDLKQAAKDGDVDALANLQTSRLYIFNSDSDAVVKGAIRAKNEEFFSQFIPRTSIQVESSIKSAHGFPTLDYGVGCGEAQAPYLMKCNFDTAGEILKQMYGATPGSNLRRVQAVPESLHVIDQNEFAESGALLAETGWIYVPKACLKVGSNCRLHVALHGCLQAGENIKDIYAVHAGYNEWAEGSNIVVLYPQARKSFGNPNACFDWFGYTGSNYAFKSGAQMKTIKAMIDRLVGL